MTSLRSRLIAKGARVRNNISGDLLMIAFGKITQFVMTGLLLLAFIGIGFFFGSQNAHQASLSSLFESSAFAESPLTALAIDSAARGKALSLASGQVEPGIDALYGLDHLTGDLFCWILNPNTGGVATTFTISAKATLGITDADADYVMTTGFMEFSFPRAGGARTSNSVVYVGEGNSGKVAGFVLLYDRQAISRGDPAGGELRLISEAITRPATARRDQ